MKKPKHKRRNPVENIPPIFPDPAMNHLAQGALHLLAYALQKGILKPLKGKKKPKCFRVDLGKPHA